MSNFSPTEILEKISQLKVVIIGDLMLDQYIFGRVDRISPEAPVPVLQIESKESRLGGAANVALNCRALGANVVVASVIGNDTAGQTLKAMLINSGISTDLLEMCESRTTTTKSRIISRSQQMIRMDEEMTNPIDSSIEHPFIDRVLRHLQIQKPDLVIFEDYDKGVLKENVINRILEHCQHIGITTAVDPKFDHFLNYKKVDIFKPNLKELRKGLGIKIESLEKTALDKLHLALKEKLNHNVTLLTLSEFGMFYSNGKSSELIPSEVRELADVSGAGDTVIAVAAMVYAVTKDLAAMARWSNVAGGLVCEETGVVPVNKSKLKAILNRSNKEKTI